MERKNNESDDDRASSPVMKSSINRKKKPQKSRIKLSDRFKSQQAGTLLELNRNDSSSNQSSSNFDLNSLKTDPVCQENNTIQHINEDTTSENEKTSKKRTSGVLLEEQLRPLKRCKLDISKDQKLCLNDYTVNQNVSKVSFKTAGLRDIKVAENTVQKQKILLFDLISEEKNQFEENNKLENHTLNKKKVNENPPLVSFKTAGLRDIKVAENNVQKQKKLFFDPVSEEKNQFEENNKLKKHTLNEDKLNVNPPLVSFKTAGLRNIKVSENTFKKEKKMFLDSFSEEINRNEKTKKVENHTLNEDAAVNPTFVSFKTGGLNYKKSITETSLLNKIVFKNANTTENKTKLFSLYSGNTRACALYDSSLSVERKLETFLQQNKSGKQFNNDDILPRAVNKNPNNKQNLIAIHNNNMKPTLGIPYCNPVNVTSNVQKACDLINTTTKRHVSCSTPMKVNQKMPIFDVTLTPIREIETSENILVENVKESARFCLQIRNKCNIDEIEKHFRKDLELRIKVLQERQNALLSQEKNNNLDYRKQRSGILYQSKESIHRQKISEALILNHSGLNNIPYISPKTAESIHFTCASNISVIKTKDGATLIPNMENLVGLVEIESAFRKMPGVDTQLVPKLWVANHFKWIVWKLASYENFATNMQNALDAENVVQQLKYRYDCEVDRAQRSTLKKIYEMDDVPQKRMVLCVSAIFENPNSNLDLELTDGWYSIRTLIDDLLKAQVLKGKIVIGTKLIISGATIENCEGCSPLEVNADIRLKINANATRRAKWDVKLGYQKVSIPISLKFNSVIPNGGIISGLKLYIARIYPIKFLEKQENNSVWRNKKAEEVRAQQFENEQLQRIQHRREIVYNNYAKSKLKNESNSCKNATKLTKAELQDLTCPETLYDVFSNSKDPEALQELLNQSQLQIITDYHQNLRIKEEQELRCQLEKDVSSTEGPKRRVSSVLQLLVIDMLDIKSESKRIFQIWDPTDCQLELLKENSIYKIHNVTIKTNGDFSCIHQTIFHKLQEANIQYTEKFKRKHISIKHLFTCEKYNSHNNHFDIDTVGIVVKMVVESHMQLLWIADEDKRIILVKFVHGPKSCLIMNNLQLGKIVAVSNLLFSSNQNHFIEMIGNYGTIVTSYPKEKHLQNIITEFSKKLPLETSEFVTECKEKVGTFENLDAKLKQSKDLNNSNSTSLKQTEENLLNFSITDEAMYLMDLDSLF